MEMPYWYHKKYSNSATWRKLFVTIGGSSGLCHYDRHGNDCCCN